MILILSKSNYESSTEKVQDWLDRYGAKYYRLNGDDFYEDFSIADGELKYKDLDFSKVNIVWNRRWLNNEIDNVFDLLYNKLNWQSLSNIFINVNYERKYATELLLGKLKHAKFTIPFHLGSVNKIEVLNKAKSLGINVPNYIVTSKKEDLSNFRKKFEDIICKPISNITMLLDDSHSYMAYVSKIDDTLLESLPDKFHFSFFQEYIDKDFEIRSFFLDKRHFSMAIISQLDPQTKTDFRNYNRVNPNRREPYKLPLEVEEKLNSFMSEMGLLFGSFDILVKDNEYYLLEVNPVGQFGMTSTPCNYPIEEEIAKWLINEDK